MSPTSGTSQADEVVRARGAALDLLARRARSRRDLEGRLRRRGFDPATVERVVGEMQAAGYLDDERFAEGWIESRLRLRPASRRALAAELLREGIGPEAARQVSERLISGEVEREAALAAASRRWTALNGLPPQEAARKLAAHLQRRGFAWDVIREALRRVAEQDLGEDPRGLGRS